MARLLAVFLCLSVLGAQPALAAETVQASHAQTVQAGQVALFTTERPGAPKRVGRLAFALVAFVIDLFVVASFIRCLCGPVPAWRWRWIVLLLIPLGVGRAALEWSTGMILFQLLYIHVPSASFVPSAGLRPQSISMGFPLFAFIFWTLRASWLEDRATRDQAPLGDGRS
jgi:hypothetical protein